jgi:hypothetical protein
MDRAAIGLKSSCRVRGIQPHAPSVKTRIVGPVNTFYRKSDFAVPK